MRIGCFRGNHDNGNSKMRMRIDPFLFAVLFVCSEKVVSIDTLLSIFLAFTRLSSS